MKYYLRIKVKIKDHHNDQDTVDLIKEVPFLLHTEDSFILRLRRNNDIVLTVNCIYYDNVNTIRMYFYETIELFQNDVDLLKKCGWSVPIEN